MGKAAGDLLVLIDVDLGKRQVFVKGRRLHHGLVGVVAITAGIVLAVHDRKTSLAGYQTRA